MPIKTLIIDDELNSRQTLRNLLTRLCPDVEIAGEAKNADAGAEMIRALKPQLVFLDIQMPAKTGFDLLASFSSIDFEVIFTTAYHDFAVKAFRFSAIDYLLKPIDPDELTDAVTRVREKQSLTSGSQVELLKELWNQLSVGKSRSGSGQKLALATLEGIHFVALQDIVWCESLNSYTKFYLSNGDKIVTSKLIKEYEEILAEYDFFRVHQSYLINLLHVKKYVKGDGGQAWMSDGAEVEVARRRKDEFLTALGNYYISTKK